MGKVLQSTSLATHLSCSQCGDTFDMHRIQHFSPCCQKPLLVNYSLQRAPNKRMLKGREHTMWRYEEFLPLFNRECKVSLGEGMTPMLPLRQLSRAYGFTDLWMKDEGLNPTGSFKARGISMAISKASEFGIHKFVIPTAGNAGGALSAYCASAGLKATVVMPKNTPNIFKEECLKHHAKLILVDGLIDECGKVANQISQEKGAFNMATMKEPYRVEGKKTMGLEIAEQMDWKLPDVILYPTGGGTGLIGIWKAFHELLEYGWIKAQQLPRMIAVQSSVCAPIFEIFEGLPRSDVYQMSIANGLSVPKAFGEDLILKVLRESKGTAIAVADQKILAGVAEISGSEGILVSPEGAAVWEALKLLVDNGTINRNEKILLLNTGNGYKYLENYR